MAQSTSFATAAACSAFSLQRLQPFGLGDVHASVLRFPFVDAGIADAMLAAQIRNGDASLVLLKEAALHALILLLGQSELQAGLSQRAKVTAPKTISADQTTLGQINRSNA